MRKQNQLLILLGILILIAPLKLGAQVAQDPPFGRPDAVVDLATRESAMLVNGQWRYHDVKIVDAESKSVGADLRPTGNRTIKTYDYTPDRKSTRLNSSHTVISYAYLC